MQPAEGLRANSPFTLYRLAAGAFDIDFEGETIGSLVKFRDSWIAEPLASSPSSFPPPFTRPEHRFPLLADALEWLGNPAQKER